ncbi:MAG: hypothetical protein WBG13_07255, partial [Pseudolabrys sp.]
ASRDRNERATSALSRIIAGVPDGAKVDLGLVRLPDGAMMFPNPEAMGKGLLTEPRSPSAASKIFDRKVKR